MRKEIYELKDQLMKDPDTLVHFAGGAAVSFATYVPLRFLAYFSQSRWLDRHKESISFSVAMAAAVYWEVSEPNGQVDTLYDLVASGIGALMGSGLAIKGVNKLVDKYGRKRMPVFEVVDDQDSPYF